MRVVHDVLEDVLDLEGRAALLGLQDAGAHREGAGDLDAVDAGDGAGLLDGQDLGALLAGRDGGHEAGAAAADNADVHVISLVGAGNGFDGFGEPGFPVAAGLRHAVGDGFLDGAGGIGGAGDAVQSAGLVLDDRGDQLVLYLGEEDRGLVLGEDLHVLERGLGEGALHSDVAQVAVSGGLIGAGLVGRALREGGGAEELGSGKADACGGAALQKLPAG